MLAHLRADIESIRSGLKGQDVIFYLGIFFIVLYYLRPQYIFSELLIIPWLQLTIVSGLILMFFQNRLRFRKEHFWLLLFACLTWLSAKTSTYPEISSRNISTPFIFFLEVLFLSNCVKNGQQLKLLLIVFLLCVFKMSFFGARVWVSRGFGFAEWGIQGPPGFFQNSGEYTLLMGMIAVMSFPVIVALQPKTKIYWLLPITAIMASIGASSRGGQLALLVGLIYLLVAYRKVSLKNLLYVFLLGAVVWTLFPDEQKARFVSAGEDETSTSRLAYWSAGVDMALNNPFLGVGFDAFPEYYHQFYKINDGSYLMQRREVSHNSLVQVASTSGIPALIIYIWLHFLVYGRALRYKGKEPHKYPESFSQHFQIALRGGIVTYFFGAFFMSVVFYPYIYILLSFSIINKNLKSGDL